MKQLVSLLMQVVISFSQTASDMRTTSSRPLRNIPMFSSAMQPEPRLIQKALITSTMHLLPSMMAVILQVSLQV